MIQVLLREFFSWSRGLKHSNFGTPGWLSHLSIQLVIWAQVMIPGAVGSSLTSGSVLSLEPAWDSLSPSLSAPPSLVLFLSLSIIILKKTEVILFNVKYFPHLNCSLVEINQKCSPLGDLQGPWESLSWSKYDMPVRGPSSQCSSLHTFSHFSFLLE